MFSAGTEVDLRPSLDLALEDNMATDFDRETLRLDFLLLRRPPR